MILVGRALLKDAEQDCGDARMMASLLARGTSTWKGMLQTMQLGFACSDRSVLPTTLSLNRPFAALGRGGRPRAARAKPEAAKAAAAAAPQEKKPPSAYALYVKEQYPAAKASAPNGSFSEISRTVSTQWKSLSETEKSK